MLDLLGRFRKRRKEEKDTDMKQAKIITTLEEFCGDDKETYEALFHTMFLDPRKVESSMKEAVENAKKLEKAKDATRARIWYEIAGGLAIYEGNVKKVVEFFSEAEKISPEMKYTILKDPEKAVAKAQEYYKQYLR
jgi:hypothetical protein